MQPQNYQTGSDSFQDNMADPNALQASRVNKGDAQKKCWKEVEQREISFMKQLNTTIYVRMTLQTFAVECS